MNATIEASASADERSLVSYESTSRWNLVNYNKINKSALEWRLRDKGALLTVLCLLSLNATLATSMIAPSIVNVSSDLGNSSDSLSSLIISVDVLGLAFGTAVVAPLSERYGRLPPYHIGNFAFIVSTAGCALARNTATLVLMRLLQGFAGSVPITLGIPTIGDFIRPKHRALVISIWSLGPFLGPAIGPIVGGFLAEEKGWRWIFWLLAILGGVLAVATFAIMRETYEPVLSSRQFVPVPLTASQDEGNWQEGAGESNRVVVLSRPLKMLCFSPIVTVISVYGALAYGYTFLLITTVPEIYQSAYQFSEANIGLVYLAFTVGMIVGIVGISIGIRLLPLETRKGSSEPNARPDAEETTCAQTSSDAQQSPTIYNRRFILMIPGALLPPVGLFLFGLSISKRSHFMFPTTGLAMVGAGLISILTPTQIILAELFGKFTASAVAACIFLRSLVGALLPMAGPPMFHALGVGWGCSLLGFVSVALLPIPFLLLRYGQRMMSKQKTMLSSQG